MATRDITADPSGTEVQPPDNGSRPTVLERLTLLHVAVFLVGCTWAFGGNASWVQAPLAAWGTLGGAVTLAVLLGGQEIVGIRRRKLVDLWPFALFNALVLIANLSPNLREIRMAGESLLVPLELPAWRPSSARPEAALMGLWTFDAVYLSCFNLKLVVRRRRALRGLLFLAAGNALVLAAFGTLQKLVNASGIYFGRIHTPQKYFFASFVYANHWGAFILLMIAVCIGLAWYHALQTARRDRLHSPAFGAVATLVLLAATVPLSGSRSSTLLMTFLLGCAFIHWTTTIVRSRRRYRRSVAGPVGGALLIVGLAIGAILYLDSDVIATRLALSREQFAAMRAQGSIGSRASLYRDTWRMAEDKLWFGWGMDSYPVVFNRYNTQKPNPLDHLFVYYRDAHNDWLQSAAEHGLVGTLVLALCAIVPLRRLRIRPLDPLVAYLLGGCGVILGYAWVEFPFGNLAVVLAWWLCLFCAARLTDLRRHFTPDTERPS